MNEALDDVPAAEARKMKQDGHEPLLHKSRWGILKRKANLNRQQQFRLRDLLRYNLQTVRAHLLKEDFQRFWNYTSPPGADMYLDFWCQQVMRSRIEPMKKFATTHRAHRELLLNYFRAKNSSPVGSSRASTTRPKSRWENPTVSATFRITELALYHALGKLPEPELTHESFWRITLWGDIIKKFQHALFQSVSKIDVSKIHVDNGRAEST
jgi:transposase